MADLVANNSAKAAVRAFLNLGSDSSDSESDVAPEDLKARPTGYVPSESQILFHN